MAARGAWGIRTVGLCMKPGSRAAAAVARDLTKHLAERGVEVRIDAEAAKLLGGRGHERSELAAQSDLLVVLGGDGTLLAAAREAGTTGVPVLGVNLGSLGFLAEVSPEELPEAMERLLGGELQTVHRMRIDVQADRGGTLLGRWLGLNDAVLTRSELSRVLDVEVATDGSPLASYHGDGLIVATPTGSTAYSLSAGGPILHPELDAIVVTPICPHTLSQRPIVLPGTSSIEAWVHPREGGAQLTVDGQEGLLLERGDRVVMRRSEHPARFVVAPQRTRFDVLRTKLGWGAD